MHPQLPSLMCYPPWRHAEQSFSSSSLSSSPRAHRTFRTVHDHEYWDNLGLDRDYIVIAGILDSGPALYLSPFLCPVLLGAYTDIPLEGFLNGGLSFVSIRLICTNLVRYM
jgi:hypothetical protein